MVENNKKIKLLMVDDEEEFLASTSQAINRRGFEVYTANDGAVALEMLKQQEFDIILLDVKMPGIDGIEVFHRVLKERPNLPVVMLTGHGSIEQAFQTSKEGVFFYLAKPCDIDVLAKRLHEVVAQVKRNAQLASEDRKDVEPAEPVRVLLVDDEVDFLESMKPALSRRKMEVTTAESGEEALNLLKDTFFDVVILDVKMSGMGGLEALRQIKNDYPVMEVILLTGHPTVEIALEGVKKGASEYIVKPAQIERLVEAIHKAYFKRQDNIAAQQKKLIDDIRKRYPE